VINERVLKFYNLNCVFVFPDGLRLIICFNVPSTRQETYVVLLFHLKTENRHEFNEKEVQSSNIYFRLSYYRLFNHQTSKFNCKRQIGNKNII
jgi:hypothetical protein